MKGVPLARAPSAARSIPGRTSGSAKLDRQHERHGERRARRERRDLAQRGRDRVLGQVHADPGGSHDRRPVCIEAGFRQPLPPRFARLEVDRHEPQVRRNAEAEVDQALALPRLRTGPIDLEHEQPGGELRSTLGKGVQARSEDDVLPDATGSLLRDEILDEASAGEDGGAEGPRERGSCPDGCAIRRLAPPACRPTSSSNTCGGGSTSTCRARHKATRTAVLSGSAALSLCMISPVRHRSDQRTKWRSETIR